MIYRFLAYAMVLILSGGCSFIWTDKKSVFDSSQQASYYNARGNDFFQKGQYDLAIREYEKAIEILPRYAQAYSNLGYAHLEKKQYDRAIIDFSRAIEYDPQYAKAYNNRGLAYFAKGEYDRAILDYNKAIEIDPGLARPYDNRGTIYLLTGETERACSDFARACELGECLTYEILLDDGYCTFRYLAMSFSTRYQIPSALPVRVGLWLTEFR